MKIFKTLKSVKPSKEGVLISNTVFDKKTPALSVTVANGGGNTSTANGKAAYGLNRPRDRLSKNCGTSCMMTI